MTGHITASLVLGGKAVNNIKVPIYGKVSDSIKQLRESAMIHLNAHLAATEASTAEEVDLLEETVSDEDEKLPWRAARSPSARAAAGGPRHGLKPLIELLLGVPGVLLVACKDEGPGRGGQQGCLQGPVGYYVGQVLAAQPHGKGCLYTAKGGSKRYDGAWRRGRRQGQGTEWYPSGEVFMGAWRANFRHGQGRMRYLDGSYFDGAWLAGERQGQGHMRTANGDVFIGFFVDGRRTGPGTLLMPGRGLKYTAEWAANRTLCGMLEHMSPADVLEAGDVVDGQSLAAGRRLELPCLMLKQPS
ncbi:hypothetical protein WJX81_007754 [Elliptochloris bilobata]|uniref:MORN repeat-containing protein 3 n=1 Tax=Elliptochloris bilobata TaxID=381761 RepID=A0AAW1QDA9_9CHLO